ncbi:MAG: T9SS type A sorting domain-containing protein [Bacteroidota bacterium]
MKHSFLVFIIFLIIHLINAQIAVGEWRDHLAYNKAIRVVEVGDKIYCATETAVFYLNTQDNSLTKLSKVNGLSDIGVSSIAYSQANDILIITYTNANIDMISNNTIYNISDIKRKQIIGNKTINNILIIDNLAYLSCGFGIVVVDIINKEIKDTYYIGDQGSLINVYELTSDGQYFYAATEQGIYKALKSSPYLVNYEFWDRMEDIPHYDKKINTIKYFNGNIYFNYDSDVSGGDRLYGYKTGSVWRLDSLAYAYSENIFSIEVTNNHLVVCTNYLVAIYNNDESRKELYMNYANGNSKPRHAIYDKYLNLWVADNEYGLIRKGESTIECIFPNGPEGNGSWNMSVSNGDLWVVTGAVDGSWTNKWASAIIYRFNNETWSTYSKKNIPAFDSIRDLVNILVSPLNSSIVYVASYFNGLIEFKNGSISNIFNSQNSTIEPILPGTTIRIYGLDMDESGNVWVTNSMAQRPFSVLTPDGQWFSLPYGSFFDNSFIGEILITQNNHKWVLLPRGKGLFAFDDKGTFDNSNDDDYLAFSVLDENGKILTNELYSIAKDLNGTIWLGTNMGILVYYHPENVFEGTDFYAQQIIIQMDGTTQYLLETETITAIEVDGANRKWIGTQSGGVFLMSEDGTQQIYNFNKDNSPLLSNTIKCIAIDQISGEVFFGTDKGIISYRGSATNGDPDFTNVYVFPNPVKNNYTGLITVTGLVANVNVKFTDISGNIVYETTALGGQAIWDGNDFSGNRVQTGVYLVFCTNEDGSKTHVTKLLLIN